MLGPMFMTILGCFTRRCAWMAAKFLLLRLRLRRLRPLTSRRATICTKCILRFSFRARMASRSGCDWRIWGARPFISLSRRIQKSYCCSIIGTCIAICAMWR